MDNIEIGGVGGVWSLRRYSLYSSSRIYPNAQLWVLRNYFCHLSTDDVFSRCNLAFVFKARAGVRRMSVEVMYTAILLKPV